ncbi:OsmC family protein [Salinithrix halophila]|uniref:OsmC family protein n=1 Tax=Salinithrix halophila TaxID=1485204 RepID=A0ABV8JH73_9BACL
METNDSICELRVKGTWAGDVKTDLQIRDFPLLSLDDTEELGGKDEAPNPLEFILASLNGCNGIMIPLVAKECNFSFSAISFDSSGIVDTRGFMGEPDICTHFKSIHHVITIHTTEPDHRLQELKEQVEARCPIFNLLIDANIHLTSEWVKI